MDSRPTKALKWLSDLKYSKYPKRSLCACRVWDYLRSLEARVEAVGRFREGSSTDEIKGIMKWLHRQERDPDFSRRFGSSEYSRLEARLTANYIEAMQHENARLHLDRKELNLQIAEFLQGCLKRGEE